MRRAADHAPDSCHDEGAPYPALRLGADPYCEVEGTRCGASGGGMVPSSWDIEYITYNQVTMISHTYIVNIREAIRNKRDPH